MGAHRAGTTGYRGNGISDGQGGDGRQHDKALHGVPPVFKTVSLCGGGFKAGFHHGPRWGFSANAVNKPLKRRFVAAPFSPRQP